LSALMLDQEISDILVNGPREVWVDRYGNLEKTGVRFDDDEHLWRIVDRMVASHGRHLDKGSPMVDARLEDGSRLHVIIPPLSSRGVIVSIRRFRVKPFETDELVAGGFFDPTMLAVLQLLVEARVNIMISGGASTGKTTLLNLISRFIPDRERVVTIEETAELKLEHPHVIPLEARPANVEGRGEVTLRDLVRNALRMRADRIIVGEVRGAEVFDMLQAMNVGHDGSLSTVHANSPEDVLPRLEALVRTGSMGLDRDSIRNMIRSSVQVVVHLARFRDGSRRVISMREIVPTADGLQTRELFRFHTEGTDTEGRILGRHETCVDGFDALERIRRQGYDVAPVEQLLRAAREGGNA
jgi:pilus assembly protein CpaF